MVVAGACASGNARHSRKGPRLVAVRRQRLWARRRITLTRDRAPPAAPTRAATVDGPGIVSVALVFGPLHPGPYSVARARPSTRSRDKSTNHLCPQRVQRLFIVLGETGARQARCRPSPREAAGRPPPRLCESRCLPPSRSLRPPRGLLDPRPRSSTAQPAGSAERGCASAAGANATPVRAPWLHHSLGPREQMRGCKRGGSSSASSSRSKRRESAGTLRRREASPCDRLSSTWVGVDSSTWVGIWQAHNAWGCSAARVHRTCAHVQRHAVHVSPRRRAHR